MTVDDVVVGGGVGGLAAAIALGGAGRRVLLLEASASLGGKLGTVQRDGVVLDTGPSVLTLPHVLDDVLARAGMSVAEHAPLVSPSPACRLHFPDGATPALDVFVDLEDTLASVRATLGPKDADELRAFLQYARGIWEASSDRFVFADAPTWLTLARLALLHPRDALRVDPLHTMAAAVRARIRSPALALLLLRYATYNGSNPYTAPATLHCIAHVELALGAFGVRGGMHTIARALTAAAERVNVDVRTNARVRAVVREGERVVGVDVDGLGVVASRTVVVNADVAHLWDALLPRGKQRGLPPSTSGATAIVRARRRSDRPAHAVVFGGDYRAENDALFRARRAPADPTVYACAQERAHARTSWPAHEPVFVMVNVPALADDAMDGSDACLATGLATLRARGLLDDGDEVVWQRSAANLATAFPGSQGALYGAASSSASSAFRRPSNRVARVPGLYLASGSAHPGGGLPLCLQSGLLAARAVLADAR